MLKLENQNLSKVIHKKCHHKMAITLLPDTITAVNKYKVTMYPWF